MNTEELSKLIIDVYDFPKPGIIFKDITPILENPHAFKSLALKMCEYIPKDVQKLIAIESRGFILASAIAQHIDVGVVLMRKPGKLPRETISQTYALEYGEDQLELHKSALQPNEAVVIIDDVLATGGTAEAAEKLVHKTKARLVKSIFFMELSFLNGRQRLKKPIDAVLSI